MSNKKFHCIVCNEDYTDTWDHLTGGKHGWFNIKDELHGRYMQKISQGGYNDQKCFCSGHITARATGQDSWETTCDDCEFLYDED